LPLTVLVAGVPLISGAALPGRLGAAAGRAAIWMLKVGSDTSFVPSVTVSSMSAVEPASSSEGVPLMRPVVASRDAQAGRPSALNDSGSPSGSDTCGSNA
jgi:hypothetical protein